VSTLNPFTRRRLSSLPKTAAVWECDRRTIPSDLLSLEGKDASGKPVQGDCILWVDGTQGEVRALNMVPSGTGHEAVVRSLLEAMESPQGGCDPSRPGKIVVSDREIQFFLRGALQELDITVDHVPSLPVIDTIFEGLMQQSRGENGMICPPPYLSPLMDASSALWEVAPWQVMSEQQIISVAINRWAVDTLYVSVLGMAGMEYGLLMYRSLESLRQFRRQALSPDLSPKEMQQAFLTQDCLYLNYEDPDEMPGVNLDDWADAVGGEVPSVYPEFGSIHPLEGCRADLAAEEAATAIVAITALERFFKKNLPQFSRGKTPSLKNSYRIPNPEPGGTPATVSITVQTLPKVSKELVKETDEALAAETPLPLAQLSERLLGEGGLPPGMLPEDLLRDGLLPEDLLSMFAQQEPPPLLDDYVPENSLISIQLAPPGLLYLLRRDPMVYSQLLTPLAKDLKELEGQGPTMPMLVIQTSRPKAKTLIDQIKQAQGIQALCFNPGQDPAGGRYQVAVVQSGDGSLHLIADFDLSHPVDAANVLKWENWQQGSNGICGISIASGVTGKTTRGKPRSQDFVGFFETRVKTPDELGLSPLQLTYTGD
jgi:hypothetical protein